MRYLNLFVTLVVTLIFPVVSSGQVNPIQIENAKPGTKLWKLTQPATGREIEGYTDLDKRCTWQHHSVLCK